MENLSTKAYPNEYYVANLVENNWLFEWPIIAGVATRPEVDMASLKELQYLNALADRKQQYIAGER